MIYQGMLEKAHNTTAHHRGFVLPKDNRPVSSMMVSHTYRPPGDGILARHDHHCPIGKADRNTSTPECERLLSSRSTPSRAQEQHPRAAARDERSMTILVGGLSWITSWDKLWITSWDKL
jgi:hypothetical protein